MGEVTYTETSRGGTVIVHNNFMYTKDKGYWRYRDRSCPGRLQKGTTEEEEVTVTVEHNHPASKAEVLAQTAKISFKKRSRECMETSRQLFQNITKNLPIQAAVRLPNYRSVQRGVERERRRNAIPLPRPESLEDIQTEKFLQDSIRGDQFLLHDTGSDDINRLIVFATKENLHYMNRSETWLGDGTFKVSPPLFTQLYTVHGIINGATIPLLYALLPNKTSDTYRRLFQIIHDSLQQNVQGQQAVGPNMMLMDFEQAAITSFKKIFKTSHMQGKFSFIICGMFERCHIFLSYF